MDHALNSLRVFLDIELDELVKEYCSEKYGKLSNCPSYKAAKALNDSANILRVYLGLERITIKEEIQWRVNF